VSAARELAPLFAPIRIGGMKLRNRIVQSPMETHYSSREGVPGERYRDFLAARAEGGVGLVTLGASSVDPRHREVPNSIHFGSDDVIDAHRALTDAVHAHGARIQPQLVHPGPDGLAPVLEGIPSVGPSVVPSYLTGTPCRELPADEIPAVIDHFREAAVRVVAAGYDGIELHAAHGYMLLGSFLTPWRNRRTDAYAGSSEEGRCRIVVELLEALRAELPAGFPLTVRLSGYERLPAGRPIDDTPHIARRLVEAGASALHVSGGVIDPLTSMMVAGGDTPDGHNVAAAEAVRRVVDVPVIAVGRLHDPRLAARLVAEGRADLVALGRPLLADPRLPEKARRGRLGALRRCISCETCIDSMATARMSCAVNAFAGREGELSLAPAAHPRSVLVIGGGPGGLEAARVAALRGHHVELLERQRRLGGALLVAATVHADNQPLLDFLLHEVRRLGVRVRLGAEAAVGDVLARRPDAVVVATGGRVVAPELPGRELPHVVTGARLRAVLSGPLDAAGPVPLWQRAAARALGTPLQRLASPARLRAWSRRGLPFGRRVAVVGGDLAAVELAEFLAERGRRVSLLAPEPGLAPEVGPKRRGEHMTRLDRLAVVVNTGVAVERIVLGGLELAGDPARRIGADSVVLAGSLEPDLALYDALRERVPECHAVGDCTGLGLLRKAVEDGARVACAL